jgi:lysophospholipase L1-like esterase
MAAGGLAETRYIAFGDSITEGLNFDEECTCQCSELCGYPQRLQTMLLDHGMAAVVENHGKGGERTPQGLTRLDEVLAGGGDVLLLMEGTNDISREISHETTMFNLAEMASRAAQHGLSTIHATLIPRYPEARMDADNVLNENLARSIRRLAFDNARDLVDPFQAFFGTGDLFELYYAVNPEDGVGHPNSLGYDLLADVFFDKIIGSDQVPPVLGLVEPPVGAEDLSPLSQIRLVLYDFGTGINANFLRLLINGSDVSFAATGNIRRMEITHVPLLNLSNPVSVRIRARDRATPPNLLNWQATQFTVDEEPPEPCQANETTLCIDDEPGDRRFKVTMSWSTSLNGGQSGVAVVQPLDVVGLPAGGLLSFFPGNPEALIKVLNGCGTNHHFWVFGSAATTLGFDLIVEDTLARRLGALPDTYEYRILNVDGNSAAPVSDIEAFDTCDYEE